MDQGNVEPTIIQARKTGWSETFYGLRFDVPGQQLSFVDEAAGSSRPRFAALSAAPSTHEVLNTLCVDTTYVKTANGNCYRIDSSGEMSWLQRDKGATTLGHCKISLADTEKVTVGEPFSFIGRDDAGTYGKVTQIVALSKVSGPTTWGGMPWDDTVPAFERAVAEIGADRGIG